MLRSFFRLDLDLLLVWNAEQLCELIIKSLLEPIRYHRDQRGDDRCWFDDYTLYRFLPESPRAPIQLPAGIEGLELGMIELANPGATSPPTHSHNLVGFVNALDELLDPRNQSFLRSLKDAAERLMEQRSHAQK